MDMPHESSATTPTSPKGLCPSILSCYTSNPNFVPMVESSEYGTCLSELANKLKKEKKKAKEVARATSSRPRKQAALVHLVAEKG